MEFDRNNLRYYEAARSVPPEAQRPFDNGSFKGTDINPMWRIKKLTEFYGPAGIGWYTEILSERAETYGSTVMAIVDLNLYVKENGEWSKPIFGTGGNLLVQATKSGTRPSDEGYKKAYTDALSIACKALGIGADIWWASDPTSKYADKYVQAAPAQVEKTASPAAVSRSAAAPDPSVRPGIIKRWSAAHRLGTAEVGKCVDALYEVGAIPTKDWRTCTDDEFDAMMLALDKHYGGAA